jgi:hypothetical protein
MREQLAVVGLPASHWHIQGQLVAKRPCLVFEARPESTVTEYSLDMASRSQTPGGIEAMLRGRI